MKNTKSLNDYKNENIRLKKTIKELKEYIKKYHQNYAMNMFNSLQAIIGEYSMLLNPSAVKIKATYKNKSEFFDVSVSNILFIEANGREKNIVLEIPISSYGGDENRTTSRISVSNSWGILLNDLDRIGFHLFPINKKMYVNVKYFAYENNYAISNSKLPIKYKTDENLFKVAKSHLEHFRERRENYVRVFSLQKILVDYKLKNGIPLI